jgi:hypothetical protein
MMLSFRPAPVLATLSSLAVSLVAARAMAEEFQCQRGDLVRRIEVQFADDADRLPCEVVYWRDDEAPGQPQALWNAEHQLGYCRDKAREMAERLQDSGWACDAIQIGSPAAAPEGSSSQRSSSPENPSPSRNAPPPNQTAQPDQATLRAALARDIQRLEELTTDSSGSFATQAATLGDLNGDGVADAAVLLTHHADGAAPAHYLLAYLFTGGTFQPVARINLDAYYKNFTEVGIRTVAGGAVEIVMQVLRADDPRCCPSGRRQATFGLRDREFVLLEESDPGA